ncbi:MAG: tetratricopeptide repeat protein [Planctomycetes bacterium]|nr:tetratricopeptide repeat protein [Planctomycetota bacterium]
MDVGRWADALERWARVLAVKPGYGYGWLRQAQCLEALGRPDEALAAILGCVAHQPAYQRAWAHAIAAGRQLAAEGRPGLGALALTLALDHVTLPGLEGEARAAAAGRPADERDAHLAAYAALRLGTTGDAPRRGGAETWVLAPARAGDASARAALREAAARDPLVRHVALLDPALAPLLR